MLEALAPLERTSALPTRAAGGGDTEGEAEAAPEAGTVALALVVALFESLEMG